jgi:hypothetical protein
VPEILRLSSATAAGATAAALTATTGAAAPRNETLPVAAARLLGTAAEKEADDAEPAADAAGEVGIEAAAFSANAMGVLTLLACLRPRGVGTEVVTGPY